MGARAVTCGTSQSSTGVSGSTTPPLHSPETAPPLTRGSRLARATAMMCRMIVIELSV